MSMHLVVFVPKGTGVPHAAAWQRRAGEAGFRLVLPDSLDAATQTGSVLVVCEGLEAAFEYYNDDVASYLEEVGSEFSWFRRRRLRRFSRAVDFVTHSRMDDWLAACVAAATLTMAVSGQLLVCGSGKFLDPAEAQAWAAEQVRNLRPRNAERRPAISAATHAYVERILGSLGFALAPGSGPHSHAPRPFERWYHRHGTTLPTEMVHVDTAFDSDEAFLYVTFWASPDSVEQLRTEGLSGNASGIDLFMLFWGRLDRPVEELLPKHLAITEDFAASGEAARLALEIEEADSVVWPILQADLQNRQFKDEDE